MLLGVATVVWLTRAIGPTYFGYYAVMVTIVSLGGLVINAGLSGLGSQRVANDPSAAGEVLWIVTASRAILASVAVVGGLAVLALISVDSVLRGYLQVGLIVWALTPFSNAWVFVAQGRLRAISALRVGAALASVVATVLLVRDASDVERVAWIPVIGALVTFGGSSLFARGWPPFRGPASVSHSATIRAYLRDGLHYLKSDASVFIFTRSDRLFLYAFATPTAVGLYAAAYSVIQPFYMIGTVVGDAMYLPLAQAFGTDRLRATFRRYVDLMCFATIPLGFFLLLFAPGVISVLYGEEYRGSSDYLAILGWVITFGYTSGVAVLPFSAWNRPSEYGNATAFGGAVNLVLNFALIPAYGGFGAAWATVAAKVAVTLAAIRYFRRAMNYPIIRDFAEYLGISLAAFAAGIGAARLLPYPTVTGIVVFGLVYVVLVALIRWRQQDPFSAVTLRYLAARRSGVDGRTRR